MKAVGVVMAFFGVAAVVAGLCLILLSLKNMNDLNMWFGLGICLGIPGILFALVGWRIASSEPERGDSTNDS